MAGMTTVLTGFSNNGNSRTYTAPGHTVFEPKIVIQKRKVPQNMQQNAEVSVSVVHGTTDAEGNPLAAKVVGEFSVRYPKNGQVSDLLDVLATIRDIGASDEFTNAVDTQEWIKE